MKNPFSALLLAGGRSSRMGEDKALLSYQGGPLWRHQVDKLKMLGAEEIMMSRSRGQSLWESEGQFVFDSYEFAGPMGGILAGMEASRTALLLVLAVDLPLITVSTLEYLRDHSLGDRGVVYRSESFFEPLTAIYPIALREEIKQSLEKGERSMQSLLNRWVDEEKMISISIPLNLRTQWSNLNMRADLALIRPPY